MDQGGDRTDEPGVLEEPECPLCGYSLEGLPQGAVCPECGSDERVYRAHLTCKLANLTSEIEAQIAVMRLREEGLAANCTAGGGVGLTGFGSWDVLVRPCDAEAAREVLARAAVEASADGAPARSAGLERRALMGVLVAMASAGLIGAMVLLLMNFEELKVMRPIGIGFVGGAAVGWFRKGILAVAVAVLAGVAMGAFIVVDVIATDPGLPELLATLAAAGISGGMGAAIAVGLRGMRGPIDAPNAQREQGTE